MVYRFQIVPKNWGKKMREDLRLKIVKREW